MGWFDYSETRFAANGFGKTTPKLVSLPEKVPERTLAVRGKVACREVVYEGAGACPRPLARPGRPRIVVGLG